MVTIQSSRVELQEFRMSDAAEVFACITPSITRYLTWDPPSWDEYVALTEASVHDRNPDMLSFVIRRRDTGECLGMAALEDAGADAPEVGLWLKESSHGQGLGTEVVHMLVAHAGPSLGKAAVTYPVAEENTASRRIAERLGGVIVGHLTRPKYNAVVYRIPTRE
jgi:RimJ/RimL family protein N-acetyltransferase